MPRKQRNQRNQRPRIPGLVWRRGRAYWQRRHEKLPGGRVVRALGTTDAELAATYAGALNTMMDRGDWGVLARWVEGAADITEVARAVREGDYSRLRRLNMDGVRLGAAVEAFLARSAATLAPQRQANIRSLMDSLVGKLGADFPMHELTTSAAEAWLHEPKVSIGQAWAAGTQREARVICGALWTHAMDREREEASLTDAQPSIARNPWSTARIPRRRRTRFAFCTPAEAHAVVWHGNTSDTPVQCMMALGFWAGLRSGEIRHLRVGLDVDLDAGVVRVQSRIAPHRWRPKTERGERDVPIPPELVEVIRRHMALGFAGRDYLLRAPGRDTPLSQGAANGWAEAAYTAAGLRYGRAEGDALTLHSTRHSYATWLLSSAVPLATVARWLGDTEAVVLQTYSHVMPRDEQRAKVTISKIARGED
jgi:integrase